MKQGPRLETHCICTLTFPFLTPHWTLLTCPALKSHFETPAYVCAQTHKHRGRANGKALLLQHFVLFHDINVLLCVLLPTGCGRSPAGLGCSLAKGHTEMGEIAKRESWPQLLLCVAESHSLGRLCAPGLQNLVFSGRSVVAQVRCISTQNLMAILSLLKKPIHRKQHNHPQITGVIWMLDE